MINLTDRPIVLSDDIELNGIIRCTLEKLLNFLDNKYDINKQLADSQSHAFRNSAEKAFYLYFSRYQSTNILYGDAFIQALMDVVSLDSRNHGITKAYKNLGGFLNNNNGLSATSGIKIKGLIKLFLFTLWCEKVIILPYNFHLGGQFFSAYNDVILSFETEVAAFFRFYKTFALNPDKIKTSLPQSGAETIYKYGPRVIWSTNYHKFEDVNVVEICNLHQYIIKYKNNNFQGLGSPPSALMLRELLINYPDRIKYSFADIESFVIWSHKPSARKYEFSDFIINRSAIHLKIELNQASKARAYTKKNNKYFRSDVERKEGLGNSNQLLQLASKEDHKSVVEYFSKMHGVKRNGLEWLKHGSPYSGREHINLKPLSQLWVESWSAWLNYRKKIQNLDSEKGINASFNLFCDYLFLYLPWWLELFPNNELKFPLSPNQLKRSAFIQRTELFEGESVSIDKLPLTFLDILPYRRTNSQSKYNVIKHLIQFLDWVEINFEEDERIAGKSFRNPLNSIDLPKIKKKSKTTKVPFTKRVYPHLLFYTYAIEAFGEYLQMLAMERPQLFLGKSSRQKKFLRTGPLPEQVSFDGVVSNEYLKESPENFGYIPFISYRGKNYPIYRLPDVYQWATRNINLERYKISGGIANYWLPHLTVLRMLIGAIETGLRLQSLQWLDLRQWDIINKRNGVPINYNFSIAEIHNGNFALPLLISTDKTKDESWDVLTVFRIRSCFHREQYFRDSINEEEMDTLVDYDGIKDSRFGQILPLFRSYNSPKPVSDNLYSRYWIHLLWGFEEYFNINVSADNEFVQFVYLKGTDAEKVPDYSNTNPKNILAISTPHSCRATYATNRTGALETSDVARQLGHSNTIVTMHYTVSTPENIAEKLSAAEREIQAEFQLKDSRPTYIRTDGPESSLYKNFQTSRIKTIEGFQFAPSIALWNTEDLTSDYDGIEMLKNSPMSQIIFRETHVCPVGEACPADILVKIVEPLRCGICPLAMRCVDHLPAISAKINQLKMNVRTTIRRADQLANKNEPNSSIDPLYESAEADANELVGWQFSHDILLKMLESRGNEPQSKYHMQSPDIVKKHLQLVSTNRSVSEFFLQRIADADAFPSMADPQIQLVADRYCRYILSGNYQPSLDDDPVTILVGFIKTNMEPLGLTISDLAEKIDQFELAREHDHKMLFNKPAFLLND